MTIHDQVRLGTQAAWKDDPDGGTVIGPRQPRGSGLTIKSRRVTKKRFAHAIDVVHTAGQHRPGVRYMPK
jgi:hypothetical protein